jgi:hypothetical protein
VNIVYAVTTFRHMSQEGMTGVIHQGTHWPADDPVVQAHPEAFSSDPRYGLSFSRQPAGYDAPVEQATAAPGELRMTRPHVDDASDEAEGLRAELGRLGVKVDGRWSLGRLRDEMSKVGR